MGAVTFNDETGGERRLMMLKASELRAEDDVLVPRGWNKRWVRISKVEPDGSRHVKLMMADGLPAVVLFKIAEVSVLRPVEPVKASEDAGALAVGTRLARKVFASRGYDLGLPETVVHLKEHELAALLTLAAAEYKAALDG